MTVGYSGTPLPRKLGIAPGHTVVLLDAPPGFAGLLEPLPDQVALTERLPDRADVVVRFVTAYADLAADLPRLAAAVKPAGAIWVAWPKQAAKMATDMTEDRVRDAALPLGLVDNKVAALTDVWSGLRVVWRRELR